MSKSEFKLTSAEVKGNITTLRSWMKRESLDAFYISSFDEFLNEYTPLHECHRYYFSGFTGSTAELLVSHETVYLYVDGRYYEQADREVNKKDVRVMKEGNNLLEGLLNTVKEKAFKRVGVEGDRTSLRYEEEIGKISKVIPYDERELGREIAFVDEKNLKEIYPVSKSLVGETFKEKAQKIIKNENEAIFFSALDSIAWLSNARGFHLAFQSTFMGKALLLKEEIFIFVNESMPLSNEKFDDGVIFVKCSQSNILQEIEKIKLKYKITHVSFDAGTMTGADQRSFTKVFGGNVTVLRINPAIPFQSIKNRHEMKEMTRSFDKANKVIATSVNWLKGEVAKKHEVSELDFFDKANEFYAKSKAIDLSFNTIAAVGEHSSIIHFGSPEARKKITTGDMVLLDSGALYASGYATDTTRTFLVGKAPKKKIYAEIYTLVLKGLINAESAAVPMNAVGSYVDSLARDPIIKAGYNYGHGTGHGVGINVHEGGIRFSFMSDTKLIPGQVVSIEPGIYLPGIGGVRLENIVLVIPHPTRKGMLGFKSLTYVGFDHALINKKMLSKLELKYLLAYEKECKKRGTELKR